MILNGNASLSGSWAEYAASLSCGEVKDRSQRPLKMKMIDAMGLKWLLFFVPVIFIGWQ